MGLDTFPFLEDHTCLITYSNTIYKLKLIYQGLNDRMRDALSQVCSERSAHCQIEDVFRAVLYNIERQKQLNPIRTQNFIVYPESHFWPLGQKVFFRDGSKCYHCHKNFIKFTVIVHDIGLPENGNPGADPIISNSGRQQAGNHSVAQSKVQPNAKAADQQRQNPSELNRLHSGNRESDMICKLRFEATPGLKTNTNEGSQSPQKASTLAAMLKKHSTESRHTSCSSVIESSDRITTSELGRHMAYISDGICEDLGIIKDVGNRNENKSKDDNVNLTSEISDKGNKLPKGGIQLRSKTAVDDTEQNKKSCRESAVHARKMIKQITDKVENVGSQSSWNQGSDQTSTGLDDTDDDSPIEKKKELVMQCKEKRTDKTSKNTSGKRQSRNISLVKFSMRTRQKSYQASQKLGFYRALQARNQHKTQVANSKNGHSSVGSAVVKKRKKYKIYENQPSKKSKPMDNGINVQAQVIKRKRRIETDLSDSDFDETQSPKKRRRQSRIYNGHGDVTDNKRKTLAKTHPRHTQGERHKMNEERRLTEVPAHQEPRFDAEEQEDISTQESESESIETVDYNKSTCRYKNEKPEIEHARVKGNNNAQLLKHNVSHAVKFGKKRSLRNSLTPIRTRKEDQTGETDQHDDDSLDVSDEEVVEVCDDGSIVYETDKVQSAENNLTDISLGPEKMQDSIDSPKRSQRTKKRLQENSSDVFLESDSTCSISPRREKNAGRRGMKVSKTINSVVRNSFQDHELGHYNDQINSTLLLEKSLRQRERQGQGSKPQNSNIRHRKNDFNPRDRTKVDEIDKEDLTVYEKRQRVAGKKIKLCQTATDFVFTTDHSIGIESPRDSMVNKKDKKNSYRSPYFSLEPQRAVTQPLAQTRPKAFSAADDIESRLSHQKQSELSQQKVDNADESPTKKSLTLGPSTSNVQMTSPDMTGSSKKSTSIPGRAPKSYSKSHPPSSSQEAQSNGASPANLNSPAIRQSSRTKRLTPRALAAFKAATEKLLSEKDGVWLHVFGRGSKK